MGLSKHLTRTNYENIWETYYDFLALLPRWREVKDNEHLKRKFCNRNRNPLFDISSSKYFITGLGSPSGMKEMKPVQDHYIQRTKAVELIFNRLDKEPKMSMDIFIKILKKYCSTVSLTNEEHGIVTSYCKKNEGVYNYQAYEACGIRIEGLSEIILED